MTIEGKVALITGGAQGIGLGIARRLAADGADIALVDMKGEKLVAAAEHIEALGRRVTTFVADVSDRDQVYAAIDHAGANLVASM